MNGTEVLTGLLNKTQKGAAGSPRVASPPGVPSPPDVTNPPGVTSSPKVIGFPFEIEAPIHFDRKTIFMSLGQNFTLNPTVASEFSCECTFCL